MEPKNESPINPEKLKLLYKPCIVAFVGLPAVGKTTLGKQLEQASNITFFDVDETRSELEMKNEFSSEQETMEASYEANHKKAREALLKGLPVGLTATYSRSKYHEELLLLSRETNMPLVVFHIVAPDEKIDAALEERRITNSSLSNIQDRDKYNEVKERYQKIPYEKAIDLDTTGKTSEETLQEVISALEPLRQTV